VRPTREDSAGNDPLDRLFHALADRTRRRLLARLVVGPARVTELARPFAMSLPAVSKHLRILEEAGLVRRDVRGRVHRLTLRGARLREVETWLDPFRSYWDTTFRELATDLDTHPAPSSPRGRPSTRASGPAPVAGSERGRRAGDPRV
jgi:DNA-binding transcriptional ArsR family regulator